MPDNGTLYQKQDWLVCLILFLVGCFLFALLAPLHLDGDDGFYMHQVNIFLSGGLPYRDFTMYDAPLGNLWQVLLSQLFGLDVLVLRLAHVPFKAALLPLVYLLARYLVPRTPALLAALLVPTILVQIYYNVAHVALNAVPFILASSVVLLMWNAKRHLPWLLVVGGLLGVATGFKQNMGLYALAATGLWLCEPDWGHAARSATTESLPQRGYYLRITLWSVVLLAALWLVHDHPTLVVLGTLISPILALYINVIIQRPTRDVPDSLVPMLIRLVTVGSGFLIATLPWIIYYSLKLGVGELVNGLIIQPSQLSAVWFSSLPSPDLRFALFWIISFLIVAVIILPTFFNWWGTYWIKTWAWGFLVIGILLLVIFNLVFYGIIYTINYINICVFWPVFLMSIRSPKDSRYLYIRQLIITSGIFALSFYPLMMRSYAAWMSPMFCAPAIWFIWQLRNTFLKRVSANVQPYLSYSTAIALLLFPVLFGSETIKRLANEYLDLSQIVKQRGIITQPLALMDVPHIHMIVLPEKAEYYHRVVQTIRTYSSPHEPIYCFSDSIIYAMAESPAVVLNPYSFGRTTRQDGERMRDTLIRSEVRVAIVDAEQISDNKIVRGVRGDWSVPIIEYLNRNFHSVYLGSYGSVWVRNDAPTIP